MILKALIMALLCLCFSSQFMIGGFEKEKCDSDTMLGSPVNSFLILNNTISTIMDTKNKNKQFNLLYYGSEVVAGTNYRMIFESAYEYMGNVTTKYFAFEVYVPLPVQQSPPDINKMLISEDKDEVLNFFDLSENEVDTLECKRDLKDVYRELLHGDDEKNKPVKAETKQKGRTVDNLISRIDKLLRTTFKDINADAEDNILKSESVDLETEDEVSNETISDVSTIEPQRNKQEDPTAQFSSISTGDASSKSLNNIDLPLEQTKKNQISKEPIADTTLSERSYFNSSSIAHDGIQLNDRKYFNQPRLEHSYDTENYMPPAISSD